MGGQNTSTVFDYAGGVSPLDFSRLKAKPWKNATHGRYKDIFNIASTPRDNKTRPMQMQPDFDFKLDRRDKNEDDILPMSFAPIERESTKQARDELKKVIMKQRITIEKNTRLYKEMRRGPLHLDSLPLRTPAGSF